MLHHRRWLRRLDLTLLVVVGILVAIGMLMIYSSTRGPLIQAGLSPFRKAMLQMVWLVVALAAMAAAAFLDYEKLASLALPILGIVLLLLLVVLILGKLLPHDATVRGTVRWIPLGPLHIQPSELAKVAVIIVLAAFLSAREEEVDTLSLVSRSLIYVAVPAGLIFMQPDLGTPVVLMAVWLVMLFVAGARVKHLVTYVLLAVLLFTAAWNSGAIRPHQQRRFLAFLAPDEDPTGAGWQLRQSMITIGSGGLWGEGIFRGKQTQLNFVPDQETDFIFTAVGEELGFIGCVVLLSLFGVLVWRAFAIAASAKDLLGRLMAAGVAGLFAIHILINISMTLGLVPVKGLPLPFVSYGGSNLVVCMMCVGLLENVYSRRQKIVF